MNKLELVITDIAKDEKNAIVNFIAIDNISAAKNMAMYLYKVCNDLTFFPNIGVTRADFTNKELRFFIGGSEIKYNLSAIRPAAITPIAKTANPAASFIIGVSTTSLLELPLLLLCGTL